MSVARRVELDGDRVLPVLGVHDANLKALERVTGVELSARGQVVTARGEEQAVEQASALLTELEELVGSGIKLRTQDLALAAGQVLEQPGLRLKDVLVDQAIQPGEGRRVLARTSTQRAYIEAVRSHDIVLGIGPAGTGKTCLAVAAALAAYRARRCRRILLTRPAVEAGERLGFLPGDMVEKVDPYLRPLHDAIRDLAGEEQGGALLERGGLEVAPLAFMRGRTLADSFIILDEAQNTTPDQMKMFLTRMGMGSRMVVTGDITQVDLPSGVPSGLAQAARILSGVEGIGVIHFSDKDVVRHRLVQDIIKAYERASNGNGRGEGGS
ncbi:MAG: PhoH family protein [Acidobacteriota bacterium]